MVVQILDNNKIYDWGQLRNNYYNNYNNEYHSKTLYNIRCFQISSAFLFNVRHYSVVLYWPENNK